MVIEILWVDIALNTLDFAAANDDVFFSIQTGTVPTIVGTFSNPDVIAAFNIETHFVTSGMSIGSNILRYDLQSQDGHGLLVAADRVHLAGNSAGMAGATGFAWRIFYRHVSVPIDEFIGITQSQT